MRWASSSGMGRLSAATSLSTIACTETGISRSTWCILLLMLSAEETSGASVLVRRLACALAASFWPRVEWQRGIAQLLHCLWNMGKARAGGLNTACNNICSSCAISTVAVLHNEESGFRASDLGFRKFKVLANHSTNLNLNLETVVSQVNFLYIRSGRKDLGAPLRGEVPHHICP